MTDTGSQERSAFQKREAGWLAGRQGRAAERGRHTQQHGTCTLVVLLEMVPRREMASKRACVQFRIWGVSLSKSHLCNIRCVGFVCHQQQLCAVGVPSLARDELWVCRANVGCSFAVMVVTCRNAPRNIRLPLKLEVLYGVRYVEGETEGQFLCAATTKQNVRTGGAEEGNWRAPYSLWLRIDSSPPTTTKGDTEHR